VLTRAGRSRLLPSLSWVALSVAVSGLLTFGYLALVARALPAVEYGWFGAYWSLALVVAFGAFLPIELELARTVRRGPGRVRMPPGTVRAVAAVTALALAAVLACRSLLEPALGGHPGLWLALVAVCLVSGPQFVVRGVLLGTGAYGWYGALLLLDVGARLATAAALVAVDPARTSTGFGWTLPVAVALAHGPLLVAWLRRGEREGGRRGPGGRGGRSGQDGAPAAGTPVLLGAVGHLLVGCLCAQALLNAAPVLVAGVAGPGEQVLTAQFVAGFTLVRVPLFLAVPLQSALVPPLAALDAAGDRRAGRRLLAGLLLGSAVLAAVGALLGRLLGPPLVSALFGERYALSGPQLALLAAGAGCHVGLLVAAQALVAAGRHRDSAIAWAVGLVTAGVLFAVVPGLVARAGVAFAVGSAAGLAAATLLLARRQRARTGHARAPGSLR
jgi:O-antigen/teichoic acid export membrane protein